MTKARAKDYIAKPRTATKNVRWDAGDCTITREDYLRSREAAEHTEAPVFHHDHRVARHNP